MNVCKLFPLLCCAVAFLLLTGCASLPYQYGKNCPDTVKVPLLPGEEQISRSNPNPVLDASDWYWPGSLFSKLILWNKDVDRHEVSEETEAVLREYLAANNLTEVKVRINSSNVAGELMRTLRNKSIAPGWRYTLGIFAWLQYTIMPGRFFGGDNYNPYSNTINLYSDSPAVALHEAGHAKDFARRKYKGTYAFAYMIPFFNLYPEAEATSDALGYLRTYEQPTDQKEGYNTLYPAYGSYIGSDVADWLAFPWNYAAMAAGVIPGHIVGRIRSATLPELEASVLAPKEISP